MRRKCKVFAALLLTLALAVCLALPSWAETRITESDRGTITLTWDTADTNVTATAYKVINVEYDYSGDSNSYEGPYDPEFYWVNDNADTATSVAEWVRNGNEAKYTSYIGTGTDNAVQKAFSQASQADLEAFWAALTNKIQNSQINVVTSESMSVSDGTATLNTTMGGYLILITGGTRIYSPVFVSLAPKYENNAWTIKNQTISVKSEKLTITKTIHTTSDATGRETATAGIKDTVYFTLEADVPNYPADATNTTYAISDILPTGMTLQPNSIHVYGITNGSDTTDTSTELINGTNNIWDQGTSRPVSDNEASPSPAPTTSFTLNFVYTQIKNYDKIRVTYSATMDEDTVIGPDGNTNHAYLDYSRDPFATTDTLLSADDTTTTYSYGIEVTKKDRDTLELLPGAIFTLKKDGPNEQPISFFKLSDGSYRVATSTDLGATTDLQVGENDPVKGILQLSGLDVGTYILTEVQAPAGYHKPSATISVPIQDNTTGIAAGAAKVPNGKPEYTDEEGTTREAGDGYVPVTVTNTTGFTLPSTGGMGTVLFTTFGILLMGAGLVVLVLFLRRRSTK